MATSIFRQRLTVVAFGVGLMLGAYYGFGITSQRVQSYKEGILIKAPVVKVIRRRIDESIYVSINGNIVDCGPPFGKNREIIVGDSIDVFYKPGLKFLTPYYFDRQWPMLSLEIMTFAGGIVITLIGILYPTRKIKEELAKR